MKNYYAPSIIGTSVAINAATLFVRFLFEGIDEGSLNGALGRAFACYRNSKFSSYRTCLVFLLLTLV